MFWKELEHKIIESYKLYNLKQSDLYKEEYWEKEGIDRETMDKRIEEFFMPRGKL